MSNHAEHFNRRTRDNGERYTTLADDAPAWLYDAVQAAHDGELPNDWRYETAAHIVSMFDVEYDPTDPDAPAEIADSLTDVYTVNLLHWVAEHVYRTNYVDNVMEQRDNIETLSALLMTAQCTAIEEMAATLAEAIAEHAEVDA